MANEIITGGTHNFSGRAIYLCDVDDIYKLDFKRLKSSDFNAENAKKAKTLKNDTYKHV